MVLGSRRVVLDHGSLHCVGFHNVASHIFSIGLGYWSGKKSTHLHGESTRMRIRTLAYSSELTQPSEL